MRLARVRRGLDALDRLGVVRREQRGTLHARRRAARQAAGAAVGGLGLELVELDHAAAFLFRNSISDASGSSALASNQSPRRMAADRPRFCFRVKAPPSAHCYLRLNAATWPWCSEAPGGAGSSAGERCIRPGNRDVLALPNRSTAEPAWAQADGCRATRRDVNNLRPLGVSAARRRPPAPSRRRAGRRSASRTPRSPLASASCTGRCRPSCCR